MKRKFATGRVMLALLVALGAGELVVEKMIGAEAQKSGASYPIFEIDRAFPQLPMNWATGSIPGIAVDEKDHVWIVQRPGQLAAREKYASENPPKAYCCYAAPPVMEFDETGKYVQGWGGPKPGAPYEWPKMEHGIHIDYKGNVWVGGAGAAQSKDDHQVMKFTKSGKFLLQIGHAGKSKGSLDTENLNQPADFYVYPKTNEVFVADGYVNRRVIVYEADTGAFKRMWGAYGNKPDDAYSRDYAQTGPGPQQFNLVHGIRLSNDGLLYVADRKNNRVQVFTPEGKYVKEVFIAREVLAHNLGTAFAIGFSPDAKQQFMYVPDALNSRITILNRDTLEVLNVFGAYGRYPGQFIEAHSVAVDSKGNLYVSESGTGGKAQKFRYKGMSKAGS